MDSEKDKKVKRIARFLEIGGTMLAEHCRTCGAPKFRYQGQVICPICDVREEGEEEVESAVEEVPETPVEVQAPELAAVPEKGKPWYESKKEVQERRQNAWFEPRRAETAEAAEEKVPQSRAEARESVPEKREVVPEKREVVPEKRETVPEREQKGDRGAVRKAETSSMPELQADRAELEALLLRKLINIAASLQDEKDPRRVIEEFELIEKGLNLIERLRKE